MFRAEEERFVRLAVRLGVLDESRRAEALRLAAEAGPDRRPVPFFFLENGILGDQEVDRVLAAMVDLHDRTVEKAEALRRDRQFTGAIGKYDAVLRANPHHEPSYWGRADAYARRGCFAEALEDYTKVLELTDRKSQARALRGAVQARLGRLEEALADLDQALESDPDRSQTHFERGSCLHRMGRLEEAIDAYTRALEREPQFIEALNNRAIAHLLRRDLERAQADWQACLAIDRKRGTVRHNLRTLLSRVRPGK